MKLMNLLDKSKSIMVTGAAGFIGFHLAHRLLVEGYQVVGIDNLNAYYDVCLKQTRLTILMSHENFTFSQSDIADKDSVMGLFAKHQPSVVVNLAAQAGVRYSIDHPDDYIQSNIIGFYNILEACRHYPVEHLVYASSSSVYGSNKKVPFEETDFVDHPVSLYAATKKSNELMAHTYSHLYKIPATGLRFFTVYGPMGRPDMAYFGFTDKYFAGEPIHIFNNGDFEHDLYRDFTYVDDIVYAIEKTLPNSPLMDDNGDRYKIYNIGNNKPEKLMDFILTLEKCIGKSAIKEYLPMQPGDVYQTYADVDEIENDFGFKPRATPHRKNVQQKPPRGKIES